MVERRILISEPNAGGAQYAFLPYVWAVLKSYWEHHGSDPKAFHWLDPIFRRDAVEADYARLSQTPPDVLGLSCYTWNWELQCDIARWSKKINPECLVVAGGPDPDYKDPDFFRKHPYIDVIVQKDGEVPFSRILEAVLAGHRELRHIPGLHLPRPTEASRSPNDPSPHIFTGVTELPASFDYSPYIEQSELYERIMANVGTGRMNAIWETNRGCPYSCSYCDWGSSTMSKVRKFELSRIEAEADWLGRLGLHFLFLADANFGILPRDIEIADLICAARAKYGYPKSLYFSSAKNNPERTVEIAKRTYKAGMTPLHVLSVQHTDPYVLAATARSNISPDKYREVVSTLSALGIPSEVQLISGIPGDNPERWKRCLAEIMEWGVHDNYMVFPYSLLPNAPAAEKGYRETWQIEAVERWLTTPTVRRERASLTGFAKSQVVIASRTYTKEQWVEMNLYSAFVKAYHNRSLTRLVALYLRFVHNVLYDDFYQAVVHVFCQEEPSMRELYDRINVTYETFVRDPNASDEIALEVFPGYPYYVDSARWLFVMTCCRLDLFYERLGQFLEKRYPAARNLERALDFQKNLVILPSYNPNAGHQFGIDLDWPKFFRAASTMVKYQQLDEPEALHKSTVVHVSQRQIRGGASLNFGAAAVPERWERWINQTVHLPNAAIYSNFSEWQIKVDSACPVVRSAQSARGIVSFPEQAVDEAQS